MHAVFVHSQKPDFHNKMLPLCLWGQVIYVHYMCSWGQKQRESRYVRMIMAVWLDASRDGSCAILCVIHHLKIKTYLEFSVTMASYYTSTELLSIT